MSQAWTIVSGKGGVGKSMIASALGLALANRRLECCLVDADMGLRSLDMLLKDGLDALYRKQWALTMLTRTAVSVMGLELFAPAHYAWGITSVQLPAGIDGVEVLRLAQEHYGVIMAGGQDQLKGRIVRIGHMGWVDWADVTAGLYALNRCLFAVGGYSGARDYLEQGLAAYETALAVPPGTPVERRHS